MKQAAKDGFYWEELRYLAYCPYTAILWSAVRLFLGRLRYVTHCPCMCRDLKVAIILSCGFRSTTKINNNKDLKHKGSLPRATGLIARRTDTPSLARNWHKMNVTGQYTMIKLQVRASDMLDSVKLFACPNFESTVLFVFFLVLL